MRRLEQRHHHPAQRVVHDPVAVGGGADEPPLGTVDEALPIVTRSIGLVYQLPAQLQELLLAAGAEFPDVVPQAFATLTA